LAALLAGTALSGAPNDPYPNFRLSNNYRSTSLMAGGLLYASICTKASSMSS
jgi:hypothetical protein